MLGTCYLSMFALLLLLPLSLIATLACASLSEHGDRNESLPHISWTLVPTGSQEQFRGLSVVSDQIVWIAGTNGTVLKTIDGGTTWKSVGPTLAPNDTDIQFRDVEAWSGETAVILSIGESTKSRIYVTRNGGESWLQSFTNKDPAAFYDCLAFDTLEHGLAVSDPIDGRFRLIETRNGGWSWHFVDLAVMPAVIPGEFAFAASGTCLTAAAGHWYLASGGVDPGRVWRSRDGHNWSVSNSSIEGGTAGGVFSVAFRDASHGIAVGGNFESPTGAVNNAAWSDDGGVSWKSALRFPHGYRSGSSWVPWLHNLALAVGPTGSDYSVDSGISWHTFDNGSFDSVECAGHACWASGSKGRVARLSFN
jgi:photosystem II stability/assembly factor-like uncharacterized protein